MNQELGAVGEIAGNEDVRVPRSCPSLGSQTKPLGLSARDRHRSPRKSRLATCPTDNSTLSHSSDVAHRIVERRRKAPISVVDAHTAAQDDAAHPTGLVLEDFHRPPIRCGGRCPPRRPLRSRPGRPASLRATRASRDRRCRRQPPAVAVRAASIATCRRTVDRRRRPRSRRPTTNTLPSEVRRPCRPPRPAGTPHLRRTPRASAPGTSDRTVTASSPTATITGIVAGHAARRTTRPARTMQSVTARDAKAEDHLDLRPNEVPRQPDTRARPPPTCRPGSIRVS